MRNHKDQDRPKTLKLNQKRAKKSKSIRIDLMKAFGIAKGQCPSRINMYYRLVYFQEKAALLQEEWKNLPEEEQIEDLKVAWRNRRMREMLEDEGQTMQNFITYKIQQIKKKAGVQLPDGIPEAKQDDIATVASMSW